MLRHALMTMGLAVAATGAWAQVTSETNTNPLPVSLLLSSANVSGGTLQVGAASTFGPTEPTGAVGAWLSVGPNEGSPAVLTLGGVTAVNFDWGTPDTYNTLVVTDSNNNTYSFVPGTNLTPNGYGDGGDTYVTLTAQAGTTLTSLTFSSSAEAFEVANFTVTPAVPEPASLALMGLGLVGVVWGAKRASA